MSQIATTAIIDKSAQLGKDVSVGPGCVIGRDVIIGDNCELMANVIIEDKVTMGTGNRIFTGSVLGQEPQSIGLVNPDTELIIGNNNTIREYVTIHRGSTEGGGKTVIGNDNFFMVSSHIAHDCEIEDNVVLTNLCQIAGHGKIEKRAWLSGYVGTHQFVTIGCYAYCAGRASISADVPPFVTVAGESPGTIRGLNLNGLRRAGFSKESIKALNQAHKRLYRKRDLSQSIGTLVETMLAEDIQDENVKYMLESIQRSCKHRMGRFLELSR